MVQGALPRAASRAGVSAILMGANAVEQLLENIASLTINLSLEQSARLDAIGSPPPINPCFIFDLPAQRIHGGHGVEPWRAT